MSDGQAADVGAGAAAHLQHRLAVAEVLHQAQLAHRDLALGQLGLLAPAGPRVEPLAAHLHRRQGRAPAAAARPTNAGSAAAIAAAAGGVAGRARSGPRGLRSPR